LMDGKGTDSYRPRLLTQKLTASHGTDSKSPVLNGKETKELDGKKLRSDGRAAAQLRSIGMQTGVVNAAPGSAYLEIAGTKVICAVYGPRQSKKLQFSDRGRLWCDFKYAPFALDQRRKRGLEPDERNFSVMLVEALEVSVMLEKFPKSLIEVYVVVLEADAGVLSAAITCASLALADAGTEMYDLVASCSAGVLGGDCILDPSRSEERAAGFTAAALCAFMPSLQQITHFVQSGQTDDRDMQRLVELSVDGCTKLHALMRNTLVNALKKKIAARQTPIK